ncbi:MAG: M28 family peptidase [Phycisphaerales bacterium]|nr:M28 family peptidase [Phycisphaerales bacterium]
MKTWQRSTPIFRITVIVGLLLPTGLLTACETTNSVKPAPTVVVNTPEEQQSSTNPKVQPGPENIRAFDPEATSLVAVQDEDEGVQEEAPPLTEQEAEMNLLSTMGQVDPEVLTYYQHVITLSNPYFEGRAPTTDGFRRAESYVEFYLDKYGLEGPFEPTVVSTDKGEIETRHRQSFTFSQGRGNTKIENQSARVLDIAFKPDEDFRSLGNAGNGMVTAPVTFVGYAIDSGPDGYSSFEEDTDLSGRIAMILRYEPLNENGKSLWSERLFSSKSSIAQKFDAVIERGAAGIIMINPPDARDGRRGLETLRRTSRFEPTLEVPAIQMTPEAANQLLQDIDPEHRDLMTLRREADQGKIKTLNFDNNADVTFGADVVRANRITTDNVAGVLPGHGDLADQWVVVGAHLDHVGYGYTGTSSNYEGQLHPGADDNASGSSALLVMTSRLARAYKNLPEDTPRRSVLMIWFGAEEAGLHGSDYFVKNPTMPVDNIQAMMNFDMVGRLRNNNLSLSGTGTAVEFDEILPPHYERSGLTVTTSPGGLGPSDHASFYRAGVPVLFPFTGLHDDYHTPTDRAFTINPEGAMQVVNFAEPLILELALMPEKLTMDEDAEEDSAPPSRTGAKVRLGIMPGYGDENGKGVRVEAVSKGTSADKGGVKKGDILVKWNDTDLEGPRVLAEVLRQHSPGDTVTLVIRRDGTLETLELKLEGR